MEFDLRQSGDVSILVASGQLTAAGPDEEFRDAIDTLLAAHRTKILVDLAEVGYIDSQGIGELLASRETVERFGGRLKILTPSKRVEDSLSITKLLPTFETFEDEKDAIASFAKLDS